MQNVGFLNLHAHKPGKWAELYQMLEVEDITVYVVAEMHLFGEEESPIHPERHWTGNNRSLSGRKGGGIGVLWRAGTSWTMLECTCSEHVWVSGDILGIPVLLRVVYHAVDLGHNEGNVHIRCCIKDDARRWTTEKEVLLVGDFNGHIQPLDGFQNPNSDLLLYTVQELSMEVLNLRPDCEDEFTWCSCIDYALVSHKLLLRVQHVHIDEAGKLSVSSDQNRIKVTFQSQRSLPATAYETVAWNFQLCLQDVPPTNYEQHVGELWCIMHTHEICSNSRGGIRHKGWWDGDVRVALDAHHMANHQCRAAVTAAHPADKCHYLWDQYLAYKCAKQRVGQRKIVAHHHTQLKSLTTAGSQGKRKYWAYVSTP
ncbi:hypothetical protein HPB52_007928 [Rhipicephalus sanguineus]|uniref:Endonuclease/exonuclease/phosphatase domain-containing protein n=1 Tax=Rhipicephalus sanguineus TaxID=34632 RepID=A0A9D4SS76_RHISA|nr:hypothetical protein HPB52_007928 [Rhipicephalus sanguineus]